MVGKLVEQRKLGPKGQVVIPKTFRRMLNLSPGEKVQITISDNSINIQKEKQDALEIMERTAKRRLRIDSDSDYEQMKEERWKKST